MAAVKWQPVMLILRNKRRLECSCGALAVIATGNVADDQYNILDKVDVWCQDCYEQAEDAEDGDEDE